MTNNKIRFFVGLGVVALIAAASGVFMWQNDFFSSGGSSAAGDFPRGYNKINEDPAVVAELPEARRQQYRKEFEELLNTIKEHPDSFAAWYNLGSVKSALGDYKGAEAAWLYATAITPNQGRTYMNLGDLYWNKIKDYEKAEWAYITAIGIEGGQLERTRAFRDLATLYRFSLNQHDKSFGVLRLGIEDLDDNGELLALAGMWAWQDGLLKEAEEFYVQYLAQNPDQEQAQKDLAQIRAQM